MKKIDYTRENEFFEISGQKYQNLTGTSDSVEIYHSGSTIMVYSENNRLPYCGLSCYDVSNRHGEDIITPWGEIFCQESQVYETIPEFDDIDILDKIAILLEYV